MSEKTSLQDRKTDTRNYGIDTLRIISMYMVVLLHTLGSGLLVSCTPGSLVYIVAWTLETLAYCAVNCYALISGYVGVYSKHKYSNIIVLWLQVLLYSVGFSVLFYFFAPGSITLFGVFRSLMLPTLHVGYWYFGAYLGVSFLVPFLNRAVLSLKRKQAKLLCITIILLFSLFPTFAGRDPFTLNAGYTMAWLVLLYILGACIRHFDFMKSVRKSTLILVYCICVALAVGVHWFLDTTSLTFLNRFLHDKILMDYTAPTMLLCGIALLILCSRIRITSRWFIKIVTFLSRGAFGVYIIHMHPQVFDYLFGKVFYNRIPVHGPVAALLVALVVFLVCNVVDNLRQMVFDWLRVKQRLIKLEKRFIKNIWDDSQ